MKYFPSYGSLKYYILQKTFLTFTDYFKEIAVTNINN